MPPSLLGALSAGRPTGLMVPGPGCRRWPLPRKPRATSPGRWRPSLPQTISGILPEPWTRRASCRDGRRHRRASVCSRLGELRHPPNNTCARNPISTWRAVGVAKATSCTHHDRLDRLGLIEELPGRFDNHLKWLPRRPKRRLADPAFATADRHETPTILRDMRTRFGVLFESVVVRQIRATAEARCLRRSGRFTKASLRLPYKPRASNIGASALC